MMFYLLLAALFVASSLFAQTAEMVVKAAANYNSQRVSVLLPDDQAEEADNLAREAAAANEANHWSQALLDYARASALLRKVEWTPDVELAASLWPRLDHAIIDPTRSRSQQDTVSVAISYPAPRAASARLQAAVYLIAPDNAETELVPSSPVDPAFAWRRSFTISSGSGDYAIEVRLADAYGSIPNGSERIFRKLSPIHIEALSDAYDLLFKSFWSLVRSLPDYGGTNRAVLGARETLDLYRRADRGQADPRSYNFGNELSAAQSRVDEVLAGRVPSGR
jgi:hypothetical protein